MRPTQQLGAKVAVCLLLVMAVSVPVWAGQARDRSTASTSASTSVATAAVPTKDRAIGINVMLKGPATPEILADLRRYGTVGSRIPQINAVMMVARASRVNLIRSRPYVAAANPDAVREGKPLDTVTATNFSNGRNMWDHDAINITQAGTTARQVSFDGTGVYVAVLDTGLLDSWRQYFPQERIATQYAKSYQGGGALSGGVISESTNKWEHDQSSHGTHVTSTILGFSLFGAPVNGVAPKANVIPVKVLNQNGSGWSSVIAQGIVYVTQLKMGPLAGSPVVINMSLGGSALDAVEKAAVDFAVANGVVLVASAGNRGNNGMGFPGAYGPVISVAAAGWIGEWLDGDGDGVIGNWWWKSDVLDPTVSGDFYITDFSSRARTGQDLDVAAPGSWVVGPFQTQSGKASYFFLGGTSMSSPHVAGIVALMLQKNPSLDAGDVEGILEAAAATIPMNSGCRNVTQPGGSVEEFCWGPGNDPPTSLDADGAGFITADAALTMTP
ncbi:MAG TPA: S8 family serine peptidase [Terriglobales bacterium]|nr:S8 family serine peptidase [Terriglobales bacterium]